jgi:hypothetical protein
VDEPAEQQESITLRNSLAPGRFVPAGCRALGRDRLERRPHRPRLGGADASPRLHPYVAQGGDVGAAVTDAMGRQAPDGLLGIHLNLLLAGLAGGYPSPEPPRRNVPALDAIATFKTSGNGYLLEQNTRPQTTGYALLDSPVALAAWMLDHDTDSYYKISRAFLDNEPSGHLTRDEIVDNVTLYWLTGTGASAAHEYWENTQAAARSARTAAPGRQAPRRVHHLPRRDLAAPPRSWVEKSYPNVSYFHEADKGGHFAAWEEPELSRPSSAPHFGRCAEGRPHACSTATG